MTYYQASAAQGGDFSRRTFLGAAALGGLAGMGGLAANAIFGPQVAWADEQGNQASSGEKRLAPYAEPCMLTDEEREKRTKRLLVVVDYQVDFVSGGVNDTIEPALAIEDALADRIKEYQDRGDIIIYTMDTHPLDHYFETREGQVNPRHCVPGEPGWELYGKVGEALRADENAILVKKGTYGSRDLPFIVQAIRSQGIDLEYIEMAGVSTTCRVLHNAIILFNFFPELPFVFDERTTASYSDEATQEQLDELEAWGFIVKRK